MIGDIREIGGYGLNIIITERCNLKCPYCFQKEHHKKFMSLDTFKNIIDSADDNCNKNIILFGGEPTLNKDFIKMAIYARNNGYNTSIITNGRLINNINEWGPYFNSIVFSIEPSKNLSKKIRKIDNFDTFLNIISDFKNIYSNIYISMSIVLTDLIKNVQSMLDLRQSILDKGIYVNILENLGNVNNWKNNKDWWFFTQELKSKDLEVYKEYIGYDKSFADGFINQGNQYLYNLDGSYITFDTNGNILPFDMNFNEIIGSYKDNYTERMNYILNNYYISNCNCIIKNKEHCSLHPGVFKNLTPKIANMLCERQRMMYMMKRELLENKEPLYGYQE